MSISLICSAVRRRSRTFFLLCLLLLGRAGTASPHPMPPPISESSVVRDGYTVEIVQVPVSHGDTASAYLLVPTLPAPHPAVLILHDHGAHFCIGKEKLVSPVWRSDIDSATNAFVQQDACMWVSKYYDGMFIGDSLAKAGYVVLAIDALYWGERHAWADSLPLSDNRSRKSLQPTYYANHLARYDEAWFETILADDCFSVDYLYSLPCVDTTRIAVFGFSMGAYRAWQLAAADLRIHACIASNWMTTKADHWGNSERPTPADPSAFSMYFPAQSADYPLVASRIAPRPILLLYGDRDPLFTPDSVRTAIRIIQDSYRQADADSSFIPQPIPYPHFFSRDHLQCVLRFLEDK